MPFAPILFFLEFSFAHVSFFFFSPGEFNRAEVTKKTRHGATALHLSSQYNQVEIVQLLLRHRDIDSNAVDLNGNAPLHMACSNGHVEPARLLLQSRANHLFKNLRGETPLHLACKWGSEAIVVLLIQEGKKTGKGTGVNEVTREGNSPLHLTTTELVGYILLKNGAKLTSESLFSSFFLSWSVNSLISTFRVQNEAGLTPLHKACQTGNVGLCELYLQGNARVNALDVGRRTPLHSAVCEGHTMVAQLLVEKYHADINARSRNGNTPLHAAAANGKDEVASYLLSLGADFRIRNTRRQTAYQLVGKNAALKAAFENTPGFLGGSEGSSLF